MAVILPLSSFAQGVDFRDVPMREALKAAASEKKLVFVDFYTTWCGPCTTMSNDVFPRPEVGDYFNATFVCLKLDAEKGEGIEMARKYKVNAYPTFIVLKADGTEVYRVTGARPADEFVEKIKKGIDPRWSPDGLTRRYAKGERAPELVNEYALLLMERGDYSEGERVIDEYFDRLSDKKRARPENFFIYSRYTLNWKDRKADHVFACKDRFVKANGMEKVEALLYNWLRQQILPFVGARIVSDTIVNPANWQAVKTKIEAARLDRPGPLLVMQEIGDTRLTGDIKNYLRVCREKFPLLESRDRFSILLDLGTLKDREDEVKKLAADLIRDNLHEVEGMNRRVLQTCMLDLEGKKEYRLRASIPAVKKGKVSISYFLRGKFEREDHEFDNHLVDISLAGRDTVKATARLLCDELANPTARGVDYYPYINFIIVPGEFAVLDIDAVKGKVPALTWKRGGPISRDFIRLNYDLLAPEEVTYNQLSMDNVIRGGDIRDYPNEFQASWSAGKQRTMAFARENKESYITSLELMEHYTWFDENEVEEIYGHFPPHVKGSPHGRVLARRLEASRDTRTGMPAKNFVKKDMNGKTVSLEKLRGKFVLLDFWGSWCGPCRASHPHLKELHEKYKRQVVFINVAQENVKDLAEARKLWTAAVKEDGLTWTQVLNNEGRDTCDMVRLFNITAFPTKVLIDPRGIVVAKMVGGMVNAEEILENALKQP